MMALSKQVHLYGIDTSYFYTAKERRLHNKIQLMQFHVSRLKNGRLMADIPEHTKERIKLVNGMIKKRKAKLIDMFKHNKKQRRLHEGYLRNSDIISVFESTLTRTVGCGIGDFTNDIVIVQVYFYEIMEDLIKNGFKWKGEEYVPYTASAGQIRLKKFVMIKKSTYERIKDSLTCGLSVEDINTKGGTNTNKYLAYLALNNSATELWKSFDIDRSIVVEDFETDVSGVVDYINYETYEISKNKPMNIPIPHTDGAGIYLPKVSKKNMMVRLPWIKGLLISTPYDIFIQERNGNTKVADIYGKEWDVVEDDIQIIFTKSQFKMWKYYDSWEHYKSNFKRLNCQAGYCNEEVEDPKFARVNYQFLQSLTDITDKELNIITKKTIDNITNIGSNKHVMMKVLGATKNNINKNYFQKSLEIYPEMLRDIYCKEVLKDVKKSLVKEAKSGKLFMDSKYAFICPDVVAFMERLFLGIDKPDGLLKDGEVSCSLYKKVDKLDILRSPSLYREHAVRRNIINDETKKWFVTGGLYVSSHDLISKLLMFDVDGDSALIVADRTFVEVAERNMKGVIPLHYEMKKAVLSQVNNNTLYDGLRMAYSNNSIGLYSNSITKVWNSDEPNLDVVKLLCLESNFSIDSAKTLFFIERPENVNNLISRYTKAKTPHFFIYAKDKTERNVEPINLSTTMGRIEELIPDAKLKFDKHGLGRFDYTMLMKNKGQIIIDEIVEKFTPLNISIGHNRVKRKKDRDDNYDQMNYMYDNLRKEMFSIGYSEDVVVDVLVAYMFGKKTKHKDSLWFSFGDIIYSNLTNNVERSHLRGTISCDVCGVRVAPDSNKALYCEKCAYENQLEIARNYKEKLKSSNFG
jgi:hypothetical protein